MAELRSEVIVASGTRTIPGSKTRLAGAGFWVCFLVTLAPPPSQAQPCASSGTFGAPTATTLPSSPIFFPVVADMNRDGKPDVVVSGPTMVRVLLGDGTTSPTPFPTIFSSVNVGSTPRGLAVADLDGDGFLDVAVAVQGAFQLAVLWGDGTGALSGISGFGTPTAPMSVALGDVDDDGDADIAVAAGDRIVIRRKGAGRTYPTTTTLNLTAGLQFIVAGDFDLDGNVDFAVTNSTTNTVVVLLGDGAAGFTQPPGSPFTTGAGTGPIALVTADFNRDGIPDLATQSITLNQVIVLLGSGTGAFSPPTTFPVASASSVLALADFDRDGNLDIVSANQPANVVSLLLGDGAGSFGAALDFAAGPASFPAAGDFDRDGRPDLVVAEPPATQVVVLPNQFGLGCPKASFARVGRFKSNPSGNPEAIAVGDLDGDNRLDAVTAGDSTVGVFFGDGKGNVAALTNLSLDFSADARGVALGDLNSDAKLDIVATAPGTGEIQVFLNMGGGTFGPRTDFAMGSGTRAVALADLNGDGKLDVVVTNEGTSNLAVRLGNGAGGFSAVSTFPTGPSPRALALGDVDGDLKLDAVVALNSTSQVAVLRGLGGGSFGAPSTLAVGLSPSGVALKDLDGDLDLDLAVSNAGSNTVTLRLGDGLGGFGAPSTLATGSSPEAIVALDLNKDGKLDLATANSPAASSDVTIRLGTGGGAFGPLARVEGFETPRALAFGDFDRDLKTDLAVPNWPITLNGLVIVPGDGAGGFGNLETGAGTSELADFAVGDLDGDGKLDLVSLDNGSTSLRVEKGNGDGTFTLSSSQTVPANSSGVVIADFNEDGRPDAAIGLLSNNVAVLLGDGAGGLGLPTTFPVAGASGPTAVAVMDFNRDGNLDLVTANSFSNNISVLPGNGLGSFGAATNTSVGTSPAGVAVGDFNRDGRADLAVANFNSNTVSILLDNGGGGFNVASVAVAGGPAGVVAADLDRNGTLDLAVTTIQSGTVTTLTGNGAGGFAPNPPISVGPGADGIGAADVNRDGVLDLAVAKRDDNQVAVLLGLTAGGFGTPDSFTIRRTNPSQLAAADFDRDGRQDLAVSEYRFAPGAVSIVLNTNCEVRHLDLSQDVSTCHAPGGPFPSQPVVRVVDDGDNPIQCDMGPVVASIVPGSGTGGAVLGGTPAQAPSAGTALWSDLSINLPGRGYELEFDHPALVATRSRTFTQGLAVSITGPPLLCEGQSASYTAGLGFNTYDWTLDGPSISMAPSVVLSGLSAGLHTLAVSVTQNTCGSSDTLGINVIANLGALTISTGGPTSFCTSCLGGILTEAHGGDGGTLAYQWGFRTTSLGPVTPIPGQTSPPYAMNGPDFPGPGTYYVVLTLSPTCGPPTVSNEIQVTVTVPPNEVPFFTVTSENLKNTLQWVYPTTSGSVRIRFNSGLINCTFPTADDGSDGSTLLANVSGTADAYGTVVHDSVSDPLIANDTHYCFTLWVDLGGSFSAGRNNRGRPFSTSGPEKWAFNLGAMTLAAPGNGSGVVHVVGMDNSVHAVLKGVGGGTWPTTPAWIPRAMNGPSQGRPSGVPVTVGAANPVLFLGSQDGHAYAFDAKTGAPAWLPSSPPLGNIVQAGPSGIFSAFGGGGLDYILVGTRDGGLPNEFYALNLNDGTIAWSYDGDDGVVNHGLIGIISGQAAVDYPAKRVYFASRAFGSAPNDNTLWCLDLVTQKACWAQPYGDIDGGVSLRGDRIYVGTTGGSVLAVNASDGSPGWTFTPGVPDGPVKGYVVTDWQTDDVYFATSTRVWSLSDTGPITFSHNWLSTGVLYANPSTPVYAPGDPWVYVGGDGKLSRLSVLDGSEMSFFAIGDGSARVGSPTIDLGNNFAYVGTDVGIVSAVQLP